MSEYVKKHDFRTKLDGKIKSVSAKIEEDVYIKLLKIAYMKHHTLNSLFRSIMKDYVKDKEDVVKLYDLTEK